MKLRTLLLTPLAIGPMALTQGQSSAPVTQHGFGPNGSYPTMSSWINSAQFQQGGFRCGTINQAQLSGSLNPDYS